jgi:murein DD-endopeptidase MepM/ murein hydrolase activator NlpD
MSRNRLAAGAVLLLVALVGALPAFAQSDAPRDGQPTVQQQLKDAYDEAVAAEAGALDAYKQTQARMKDLGAKITEVDGTVRTVQGYLDAAGSHLAEAETELADGERRRAEVQQRLDAEKNKLRDEAIAGYMAGDVRQAALLALLRSDGIEEVTSTRAYTSILVDRQLAIVGNIASIEAEARALRDHLAEVEKQARADRDNIANFRQQLDAQRDQLVQLRAEADAEAAKQQDLIAQIRAKKNEYVDRMNALERDSDGIGAALKARELDDPVVLDLPMVRTPIEPPVTIVSGFGSRMHPIFEEPRMHTGIDIDAKMGTPIRAAADGEVVMASSREGYGLVVAIDHGSTVGTVYAHQSKIAVTVGQFVKKGDVIGYVGATGYATGPHLHFEYRVLGAPIDPTPHVEFNEPQPTTTTTTTTTLLPPLPVAPTTTAPAGRR